MIMHVAAARRQVGLDLLGDLLYEEPDPAGAAERASKGPLDEIVEL
jgi:hypothetical protein